MIFSGAVALLLVCALFVGGVFGAEYVVPQDGTLAEVVALANENSEDDTIILTEDVSIDSTLVLSNGRITITTDGSNRTISNIGDYSLFQVNSGADLVIEGTPSGYLILNGNNRIMWSNGGAVYVNGGNFIMNANTHLKDFGFLGTGISGNGAVYVASGKFTMNGGSITGSVSMQGSGVYVSSNGEFEMKGGEITANGHDGYSIFGIPIVDDSYGGGVFIEDGGHFSLYSEDAIYDNKGDPQYVYSEPSTKTATYTVRHLLINSTGDFVEAEELRETNLVGAVNTLTNAKALPVPGYAADAIEQEIIAEDGSTVVDVYYRYAISYKIEIPTSLYIAEDTGTSTFTITATEMWLVESGWITVTVSSANLFHLAHTVHDEVRLSYTLSIDGSTEPLENNSEVARFTMEEFLANSQTRPFETLRATVTEHPPITGDYQDILTFTCSYHDDSTA